MYFSWDNPIQDKIFYINLISENRKKEICVLETALEKYTSMIQKVEIAY